MKIQRNCGSPDTAQSGGPEMDGLEGAQISQEAVASPTWNRSALHQVRWGCSVVAVGAAVSCFLALAHALLEEG